MLHVAYIVRWYPQEGSQINLGGLDGKGFALNLDACISLQF